MELAITVEGADLPATLTTPPGRCRAGLVVLHGAEASQRSYFLYQHLAVTLATHGVAVLRYDRRESLDRHDVPLLIQAADALAAAERLRDLDGAPVGLWGYSQGAWAATLAAVTHPVLVSFLICVSFCGVSPAVQMRVGTAKQLRKYGFTETDVALVTRRAVEGFIRGDRDRRPVQAIVDHAAAQPWFPHAHLPAALPPFPGTWRDMDYDPQPVLDRLSCPVLAFHGESDEWIPIEESLKAWEAARRRGSLNDLTIVSLRGANHCLPTAESLIPMRSARTTPTP